MKAKLKSKWLLAATAAVVLGILIAIPLYANVNRENVRQQQAFTRLGAPCPPGEVPKCPFPDKSNPRSYFFPHPNDCHWFFYCDFGVAYCKECPAGLHWNVELETCDYPWAAGCCNEASFVEKDSCS